MPVPTNEHSEPPATGLHVVFSGRVQGVGFRVTVVEMARGIPVAGWVRNRDEGTVELVIRGEFSDCEELVQRIQSRFRGGITSTNLLPFASADQTELPESNEVVIRPTV